jgi:hypothetical protein
MARKQQPALEKAFAAFYSLSKQDQTRFGARLSLDKDTWIGGYVQALIRDVHNLEHDLDELAEQLGVRIAKERMLAQDYLELSRKLSRRTAEDKRERQRQLERAGLLDAEIAEEMGNSPDTVRWRRRSEARKKLPPEPPPAHR